MHRALTAALIALTRPAGPMVAQSPSPEDEAGVRAALQHYLNGHATGNPEEFRQGAGVIWCDGTAPEREPTPRGS